MKLIKPFLLNSLTVLVICISSVLAAADNSEHKVAELYWIDAGVPNRIMQRRLVEDVWSDAVVVHEHENASTSLAVTTDRKGHKTLFWSEQSRARTVLMYKTGSSKSESVIQWSQASVFTRQGRENMASSSIVDGSGVLWLFWSSNNGGLDDIYFSKKLESGWSSPEIIHPANEVPDVQPTVELLSNGDIQVRWKTYSFSANDYVEAYHVFELDHEAKNGYKTTPAQQAEANELIASDVELPSLTREQSITSVLHFPNNKKQQSFRLIW